MCFVFSDITPSSWRQGDALIRRVLGPVKRPSQSHSPPTHDTLQPESSAGIQSRVTVDTQSELVAGPAVPSLMQGSRDVLAGELDEPTGVNVNQEVANSSPVGLLSNSADEVLVSEAVVDDASGQHQQLPAATNASYLNIQEPSFHHISISLPGNVLICNDVTAVGMLTCYRLYTSFEFALILFSALMLLLGSGRIPSLMNPHLD